MTAPPAGCCDRPVRASPQIGSPLVIAHRGGRAEALPEHTLEAYRRAIEDGADGLECDVRLTRDGHLVCIHDRRLDRTSNGRGRVSASTLDELASARLRSWHAGHVGNAGHAGPDDNGGDPARVLTLEALLAPAVDAGRPLRLLIETKHPSRFGAAVEEGVVDLLRRFGLAAGDRDARVSPPSSCRSHRSRCAGCGRSRRPCPRRSCSSCRSRSRGTAGRRSVPRCSDPGSRAARPGPSWCAGPTSGACRCTCGRSTREDDVDYAAQLRGGRDHHRPAGRTCCPGLGR